MAARIHLYLHPDDYDAYRSGEEVGGLLIHDTNQNLIHIDVDEKEVVEYRYPLVTIKRRS
jgi:hypothetical protein